jgi:hypothetical protein
MFLVTSFQTVDPKERNALALFMYEGTQQNHGGSIKTAHLCAWKQTPTLHNINLAVYSVKVTLNKNVI